MIKKKFAPVSAVVLAGTVFYQHATHHHEELDEPALASFGTPLSDDAERRMPKWPDQYRLAATAVSTGSMTSMQLDWPSLR